MPLFGLDTTERVTGKSSSSRLYQGVAYLIALLVRAAKIRSVWNESLATPSSVSVGKEFHYKAVNQVRALCVWKWEEMTRITCPLPPNMSQRFFSLTRIPRQTQANLRLQLVSSLLWGNPPSMVENGTLKSNRHWIHTGTILLLLWAALRHSNALLVKVAAKRKNSFPCSRAHAFFVSVEVEFTISQKCQRMDLFEYTSKA